MSAAGVNGRPAAESTIVELAPELRRELEQGGWMYPWNLGPGVWTPLYGENLRSVHDTRSEMIEPLVREALAAAGPGACAVDLACNEGWFSHRLLEWGAERVIGIDVREDNIRRAELLREHYGIPQERLSFRLGDALTLDPAELGRFDVVLMLGLIYHLEQPMEAIRIARRLTGRLCVIESQLVRQDRPVLFSNGAAGHFRPTELVFGGWFEQDDDNPLASIDGLMSLLPNRAALEAMARHAGFDHVQHLQAASHHDTQYLLGDRGIVAGHVRLRRWSAATGLPLPPAELARRSGSTMEGPDPTGDYERTGRKVKQIVVDRLPRSWSWEGKRVLDFGCGAGRVLRHFHREAAVAEISGCDIDVESVEWVQEHLCPPFEAFTVREVPRLPVDDGSLDLVWAASVFTHLTDHWAGWLAELHRALRDDGLLVASFLGASMAAQFLPLAWQEERTGMLVTAKSAPWELGGPAVFHSEWWLRAHWGRAFDVVSVTTNASIPNEHGWVLLRKRPGTVTREQLEAPADDPRELEALRHNIEQLHAIEAAASGFPPAGGAHR